MADCKHPGCVFIPDFLAMLPACQRCGGEMPQVGCPQGIRDWYMPGDPPWRRQVEVLKRDWACGILQSGVYQCPECCFVGTDDDFDCLGGDGDWFCNQCGHAFEAEDCTGQRIVPLESHYPLFNQE